MKIIHTADNHLDMPLTLLTPKKALLRKRERLESFSEIIEYTIKSKADMLIISGDLFHSPTPSEEIISFCREEFSRLGSTPVFIALGNHDYSLPEELFPGNVHIFPPSLTTFSLSGVNVTGASFSSPSASFSPSLTPPKDKDKLNLLVLHADLSQNSIYNPVNKDFLSTLGYDYIALGHVHKGEIFHRMAYPGCHDGAGFDETGVKGFILCDVEKSHCNISFIPSSYRLYEVIEIDISSFSSTNSIINALLDKMEEGIYKIILTGTPKEGFFPNLEYIRTVLSEKAFFVKIEEKYSDNNDISSGELYTLSADYIGRNCPSKIQNLALDYVKKSLKGVSVYDI